MNFNQKIERIKNKMGLIQKLLGIEGKARVVVVTDEKKDVRYVDMSPYKDVYELLQQELRNNPGINRPIRIDVSYQGRTLRVKAH